MQTFHDTGVKHEFVGRRLCLSSKDKWIEAEGSQLHVFLDRNSENLPTFFAEERLIWFLYLQKLILFQFFCSASQCFSFTLVRALLTSGGWDLNVALSTYVPVVSCHMEDAVITKLNKWPFKYDCLFSCEDPQLILSVSDVHLMLSMDLYWFLHSTIYLNADFIKFLENK